MTAWQRRSVELKFQLSDKTLLTRRLDLLVSEFGPGQVPRSEPAVPAGELPRGCAGWLARSLPLVAELPKLVRQGNFLRYVPAQYQRYYIDLGPGFEAYKAKFSSKTRSTLQRKLRRWTEHCGGELDWRVYRSADELLEFHRLARQVSAHTYQERLLDAGLPTEPEFLAELVERGQADRARAYLLFDCGRPVAYLYCPVDDGVLLYAYLGYSPTSAEWSVGTVLQWLALESIFAEGQFRLFDFTEGQSEHKRLFATGSQLCGNVYFLQARVGNAMTLRLHHFLSRFSAAAGGWLDRAGLGAGVRRWIRGTG